MDNNVVSRAVIAVVIGVITWIVAAFVGLLVSKYLDSDIGGFITGIAVLFGVLAAIYYFLTSKRLV